MNKIEIAEKLLAYHQAFINYVELLNKEQFEKKLNEKWSASQHTDHIYKSIAPVNLAFKLPKFLLKLFFGKTNRPSKSFDELILKYQSKLQLGGKAMGRFIPTEIKFDKRNTSFNKIINTTKSICTLIVKMDEKELDLYILPHPLLGKLTLREMLYFTIYHVEHHQKLIEKIFNPNQIL